MSDCLFCRMLRGEIPAKKVYEDEKAFAFHDINPQAPVHVIVIPKTHIQGVAQVSEAEAPVVGHLFVAAAKIARELGIEQSGYRTVFNVGPDAGQTVHHIHLHVIGGRPMGWPPFR